MKEHELGDLLSWHIDPRPLEMRVFLLMKDTRKGATFRSFLVRVWEICVQDPTSLSHLAFRLYDVSNRGYLGLADVRLMFREAFGAGFMSLPPVLSLYKRLTVIEGGDMEQRDIAISLPRFLALAPTVASLLAPIFSIQRAMQNHILGLSIWENVKRRRDAGVLDGSFNISGVCQAVDFILAKNRRPTAATMEPQNETGSRFGVLADSGTGMGSGVSVELGEGSSVIPPAISPQEKSEIAHHPDTTDLVQPISRTVLPVTDRHWLPTKLLYNRPRWDQLKNSHCVDHPGFHRPLSPGREFGLIELGIIGIREALTSAIKKTCSGVKSRLLWRGKEAKIEPINS